MESATLEIKVVSAKGLNAFNFFHHKLDLYAAVSIRSAVRNIRLRDEHRQEQRTSIDKVGDGNPEWNYCMSFDLNLLPFSLRLDDLFLIFELRNHRQLFGDKVIGDVRVPLTDLIGDYSAAEFRFVDYEVRGGDGKPNGILSFAFKVFRRSYPQDVLRITGYTAKVTSYQHQLGSEEVVVPATMSVPRRDPSTLGEEAWRIHYPCIDSPEFTETPSAPPLGGDQVRNHPPPPSSIQPTVRSSPPTEPPPPNVPSTYFPANYYPPPQPLWPAAPLPPPPLPLPQPVQPHPWDYCGPPDRQQFTGYEYDHARH